jgi:hypothetical protein
MPRSWKDDKTIVNKVKNWFFSFLWSDKKLRQKRRNGTVGVSFGTAWNLFSEGRVPRAPK